MRSRAAAAILADAGLEQVFTMQGGMKEWEGMVAAGPPESGMAYFGDADSAQDLAQLAWLLEDGSRLFYVRLNDLLQDEDARKLFQDLAKAEISHEMTISSLYKSFSGGRPVEESLPRERGDIMEGGVSVSDALVWARDKDVAAILEFAMALETNAYDLYIKMRRRLEGDARNVFDLLAGEEKKHLERLAAMLEKKI